MNDFTSVYRVNTAFALSIIPNLAFNILGIDVYIGTTYTVINEVFNSYESESVPDKV